MLFLTRFTIKRMTRKIKAMQHFRAHNQPSDESLGKERNLYHTLAKIYLSLRKNKKYPFAREMAMECYRAAAVIDDSEAQYSLGKQLLEEAKFREQLEQEGIFASSNNERQMRQLFDEALAYLSTAENLQHIQAKRLHGLCYINGWGVDADKKKGFDLIVASIDQENSWDKVPQIFASMGLNKPEFFSQLSQHRNKGS